MNEATQAYQSRKAEINKLLDLIITEAIPAFDDQQAVDPNNWCFVGTLGAVVDNLTEIAFDLGAINSDEARALTGIEY